MGKKYVANAFHNRSLIDKGGNSGGGGGSASVDIVAEETKIGTFLGKDLYRKVITVDSMTSYAKRIREDLYNPVHIYGTFTAGPYRCALGSYYMSPISTEYFDGDPFTIVAEVQNGTHLVIHATNGYKSDTKLTDFIIFVEYTKD